MTQHTYVLRVGHSEIGDQDELYELRGVPPDPVRRKQGIREPEELTEARNQLLQPNYFGLVKIQQVGEREAE
jgi:hypothetical protein